MKYAVGILAKDRWAFTHSSLMSLLFSGQDKDSYDIFIVDNGSEQINKDSLRSFVSSQVLPIKRAMFLEKTLPVSTAWNLFLAVTQEYEYRILLDNDVVIYNPIISKTLKEQWQNTVSMPKMENSSLMPSIAQTRMKASKTYDRSDFLNIMREFCINFNSSILGLVCPNPQGHFRQLLMTNANQLHRNMPFLHGGCLMITKQCFETIGYLDERLPFRIDVEYSQRAIRNGMNIGYHPDIYGIHLGYNITNECNLLKEKAMCLERVLEPIPKYAVSIWQTLYKKINATSSTIINLN